MVSVSTFMYCESAQVRPSSQGPKLVIEGPLHVFFPKFVPGQYSFSVVVGLLGITLERHSLRYHFQGPNGDNVIDTNEVILDVDTLNTNKSLPEEVQGFIFNMDFRNVELLHSGQYVSKIIFDGKLIGEFPIIVRKAETIDGRPN